VGVKKMRYKLSIPFATLPQEAVSILQNLTAQVTGATVKFGSLMSLFYNVSATSDPAGAAGSLVYNFDSDATIQSVSAGTLTVIESDGYEVFDRFTGASTVTQFQAGVLYLLPSAAIQNIKTSLTPENVAFQFAQTIGGVETVQSGNLNPNYVAFYCMKDTNIIGATSISGVVTVNFNKVNYLSKQQEEQRKLQIRAQQFSQTFLS